MEADFGELGGVGGAEMFDKIVLVETSFEGAILFNAPFAIAAAGFPVGDIAFGDFDGVFVESADDFGVGNVVAKHAIDHVADGKGKASDFAVATDFAGRCRWMAGNWLIVDRRWLIDTGVFRVACIVILQWSRDAGIDSRSFGATGRGIALNGRKDVGCGSGTEVASDGGLIVCHMVKGVVSLAMSKESFFWCPAVTSGYQWLPTVTKV